MITASQAMALDKLISGFTEVDNEYVYRRTTELERDVKLHHVRALFERAGICDLDGETMGVAMDSMKFQELVDAFIWDSMTTVAQYERARMIAEHREAA